MTVDRWGVADGYNDVSGVWHNSPPETIAAVRRSLGAPPDGSGEPPEPNAVLVLRAGETMVLDRSLGLYTEDGDFRPVARSSTLPSDLPIGYHRLVDADNGYTTSLIVVPPTVHRVDRLRTWGWALQLYALRSQASWGIGDLGDLSQLGRWSARRGAGMTLISPLHASTPVEPQQNSPYFPSSRVFRNPLHLRMEDVPGYRELARELGPLASRGRTLNNDRRIDRDAVFRLKQQALHAMWRRFRDSKARETRAFESWVAAEGPLVWSYATFCALSEQFGCPWQHWPEQYRRPTTAAVFRFRDEHLDEVSFHVWQQWLLDTQLQSAAAEIPIVADLAVGVDRAGADAWIWQETFALDLRIGAPPDVFNASGQDWGLPPFDHLRLRSVRYEPFIRTVRAALRHAGGVRVDHVMGLFRLYVMPEGAPPSAGCYVYQPFWELLGILALESVRARAWVLGEDLGTIEDYVSLELAERAILSYKVMLFEDGPTENLPIQSLGAVTTHDLPTVAGLLSGSDELAQRSVGIAPNVEGLQTMSKRLTNRAGTTDGATTFDVINGVHATLAASPCAVAVATIEDALGVEERANMPGTTDEWPNWRLAYPTPLEELLADGGLGATATVMNRRGNR